MTASSHQPGETGLLVLQHEHAPRGLVLLGSRPLGEDCCRGAWDQDCTLTPSASGESRHPGQTFAFSHR
jgi:hypothetical protein